MERIKTLLADHAEHKYQLRSIEKELAGYLVDYEGSVIDALILGIIRPNFPTPAGFKHWLKEK